MPRRPAPPPCRATINFPLFIIGPAIIFYVILAAQGLSLDEARELGWLFEAADQNSFWTQWGELYGGIGRGDVHWQALPQCLSVCGALASGGPGLRPLLDRAALPSAAPRKSDSAKRWGRHCVPLVSALPGEFWGQTRGRRI